MRHFLLYVAVVLAGLFAGGLSALWISGVLPGMVPLGGNVRIGVWSSDWSVGSETANPYVRARIARHGLLALRRSEAVYFNASTDDQGRPLDENCIYQVSGGAMPAAWWSITLYDADSRLPMNDDDAMSYDATVWAEEKDQDDTEWTFIVSSLVPAEESTAWVSSLSAGTFDLTLRLYKPSEAVLAEPESVIKVPRIERLKCRQDPA